MTPEQKQNWLNKITTHGAYVGGIEKPEHAVWRSMLARCSNENHRFYSNYGGRGIKVCRKWYKYENFISDMGDRPAKGYSLERINNNKGYAPNNCRWATRSEQQKNKSTTKIYTDGVFKGTLVECAKKLGISKELAHMRWKAWGSFEKGKVWRLQKRS